MKKEPVAFRSGEVKRSAAGGVGLAREFGLFNVDDHLSDFFGVVASHQFSHVGIAWSKDGKHAGLQKEKRRVRVGMVQREVIIFVVRRFDFQPAGG